MKEEDAHLGRVVDISAPLEEDNRDALVAVVGGDMERGEAGLAGHVGVVVVLQEQGGRLRVVLLGRDVQGWQAHLASCVVLQQNCDHLVARNPVQDLKLLRIKDNHLVMALLQGNSKRSEAILGSQGLAGTRGEKEPNHLVVILLNRKVKSC